MSAVPLVLASSSPRRKQLLGLLGLEPRIDPADIDETVRAGEEPIVYAERLAREKAAKVASRNPDAVVIAADTIVVLGGDILGKPEDREDAERILRRLSGKGHLVHTAIAVSYRNDTASGVETTRVWVRPLDDDAIRDYVRTGEPMDKAGAYGIQGYGAVIVERIEGDYFTVMGLGLGRLVSLLPAVGLTYRFGGLARLVPRPARP